MGTVRFVLREDKPDKNGLYPVEMVYQISGQRKYFRPKEKLAKVNWSATSQQAIFIDKATAKKYHPEVDVKTLPSLREIQDVNNSLAALRKQIAEIEKRFELNSIIYNPIVLNAVPV